MGKTLSKAQRFPKRRASDVEDMKGFLRSKQKRPASGSQDHRSMSAKDWQDDYEASESYAAMQREDKLLKR